MTILVDHPAMTAAYIFHTQELLAYVETRHDQLDTINLATILYRLARLYTFIQVPEQRVSWKLELQENPNFAVLLRECTASAEDDLQGQCRQAGRQAAVGWGRSGSVICLRACLSGCRSDWYEPCGGPSSSP